MADIRPDDLVPCKLCEAVITRAGRPRHIEWHARIAAKMHTVSAVLEQSTENDSRFDETLAKHRELRAEVLKVVADMERWGPVRYSIDTDLAHTGLVTYREQLRAILDNDSLR